MSPTQHLSPNTKYVLWLDELLFSLNLALLVIPVLSVRLKFQVLTLGHSLRHFVFAHLGFSLPVLVRDAEPNRMDFAALTLTSAAALFLLLRLTARLSLTGALIRAVPGVVAVIGLPLALNSLQRLAPIVLLEAIAATMCVLLYLVGKWRVPSLVNVFLLALHFAIWTWGARQLLFFWFAYPLVGFCSAVAWAIYLKQRAGSTQLPDEIRASARSAAPLGPK